LPSPKRIKKQLLELLGQDFYICLHLLFLWRENGRIGLGELAGQVSHALSQSREIIARNSPYRYVKA
jgi:hypothetical protein